MDFYHQKKSTISTRRKGVKHEETINWSQVWEDYKEQFLHECLPSEEMLDGNTNFYHVIRDGDVLYNVECDRTYVLAFFCELIYTRMRRDESFLDSIKGEVAKERQEMARRELENQVSYLARVRYNSLPNDDPTTLEEIESQIRESLGM